MKGCLAIARRGTGGPRKYKKEGIVTPLKNKQTPNIWPKEWRIIYLFPIVFPLFPSSSCLDKQCGQILLLGLVKRGWKGGWIGWGVGRELEET